MDAYGVLVETAGPLPGAAAFVDRIRGAHRRVLLLSNDASRLVSTVHRRLSGFGIDLSLDEILTSGDLIAPHFAREDLVGRPTIVLGTGESRHYVREAGGEIVKFDDESAEVVVAADDDGFDFLTGIENTLTTLIRRLDRGLETHLVLPNPDLIYPKGNRDYGLTSGSVALVLEQALRVRFGARAPQFIRLGKPYEPMFKEAARRTASSEGSRIVMMGDQLRTDILGARKFGVDSVLVGTGLTDVETVPEPDQVPTWFLPGLTLDPHHP